MCQAVIANQVAARVHAHTLDTSVADFAQFKRGVNFTIQIKLLFCDTNMLLRPNLHALSQVRIQVLAVWIEKTAQRGHSSMGNEFCGRIEINGKGSENKTPMALTIHHQHHPATPDTRTCVEGLFAGFYDLHLQIQWPIALILCNSV
jgi:hypothetical protein